MKRLLYLFMGNLLLLLGACFDGQSGGVPMDMSVSASPLIREKMHLKGPVKTMTVVTYDANVSWTTRYDFDSHGYLRSARKEVSTCGDEMVLHFTPQGKVVDTTYTLYPEYGCFDPETDVAEIDLNPTAFLVASPRQSKARHGSAPRHTSETVGDLLVENDLNESGCVTHYRCNGPDGELNVDFSYDSDGVTLSHIHLLYLNGEGGIEEGEYDAKQYDSHGNPTQWPIASPCAPFDENMYYMYTEFVPNLYIGTFSYEYY